MFRSDSVRQPPVLLAMALLIAACGTTPTEAVTDGVRFRLLSVNVSQPADADVLSLRGELTNTRRTPLVSGGCLRPTLAIDSATATGWAPVRTKQLEELIACIRAFTVDPGATVGFEATLYPDGAGLFTRTAALRLRVVDDSPGNGPVVPLTLP
jgi:hypothetical protein